MPVRFFVTDATVADCSIAENLIAEFQAEYLLADRGYDTDAIIQHVLQAGMTPVIPLRHLVEKAFLHLKKMGGIN